MLWAFTKSSRAMATIFLPAGVMDLMCLPLRSKISNLIHLQQANLFTDTGLRGYKAHSRLQSHLNFGLQSQQCSGVAAFSSRIPPIFIAFT